MQNSFRRFCILYAYASVGDKNNNIYEVKSKLIWIRPSIC